jgi:pantetheine-phosphate adenylyltransferase
VRRCVCPGSYDPITLGHLDVIARAATLYDEVVVAVLHNPAKHGTFAVSERLRLVRDALAERQLDDRVRVEEFAGRLLVDVCRDLAAGVVVKGLRGPVDFSYELPMAVMNRDLAGIETVFLVGDPALAHVSSSLVREVASYGGDVSAYVPAAVNLALRTAADPTGRT